LSSGIINFFPFLLSAYILGLDLKGRLGRGKLFKHFLKSADFLLLNLESRLGRVDVTFCLLTSYPCGHLSKTVLNPSSMSVLCVRTSTILDYWFYKQQLPQNRRNQLPLFLLSTDCLQIVNFFPFLLSAYIFGLDLKSRLGRGKLFKHFLISADILLLNLESRLDSGDVTFCLSTIYSYCHLSETVLNPSSMSVLFVRTSTILDYWFYKWQLPPKERNQCSLFLLSTNCLKRL